MLYVFVITSFYSSHYFTQIVTKSYLMHTKISKTSPKKNRNKYEKRGGQWKKGKTCTFATTMGFAFFLCGSYKYSWEVAASFDLSVKRGQCHDRHTSNPMDR